ncbi:MAG: hypothetical protein M3Y13_07830 [Armatimonadota bacterium]|nr:hypothetical protein [Armatimonadota bacterium]
MKRPAILLLVLLLLLFWRVGRRGKGGAVDGTAPMLDERLSRALLQLSTGDPLSDTDIEAVLAEIDQTLRNRDAQIDWDDAWDALDRLIPVHQNAAPFLCRMMMATGTNSSRDLHARLWALRALGKTNTDLSALLPSIQALARDENRDLRREAAKLLKKRGFKPLTR